MWSFGGVQQVLFLKEDQALQAFFWPVFLGPSFPSPWMEERNNKTIRETRPDHPGLKLKLFGPDHRNLLQFLAPKQRLKKEKFCVCKQYLCCLELIPYFYNLYLCSLVTQAHHSIGSLFINKGIYFQGSAYVIVGNNESEVFGCQQPGHVGRNQYYIFFNRLKFFRANLDLQ